jgi:adenylyltransferase/sulfurtransferase
VQLSHPGRATPLDDLVRRLAGLGRITRNPFLLRLAVEGYEITLFPDGRAIIHGTHDPAVARTIYARYVGS